MKLRTAALIALAASLALPLSACAAGESSSDAGGAPEIASMPSSIDAQAAMESGEYMDEAGGEGGDGAYDPSEIDASVIRNGWISLEVDNPADSANSVADVAKELGGYAKNISVEGSGDSGDAYADVTLRVPADRFDELFDRLAEVGDVSSEGRAATDVTAQHVDLKARVAALEASVERLTELMKGAESTSDLLEAETALSDRQQELDGLSAQLEALESQVDLATMQVSLHSETTIPGGPANFWDGLLAGLDSMAVAASGALIMLGVLLPWLALVGLIALVVILIVRSRRVRKARETTDSNASPDETAEVHDEASE